jgi:hypothetical protein
MFVVMWEDLFDFLLQVIYETVSIIITGTENEWRISFLLLYRYKLWSKKDRKQVKLLSVWKQFLLNVKLYVFNWAAPYFSFK